MQIRGRSCIAAFMACLILLLFAAPVHPSYNSEAGRTYAVACHRLSELRKSAKKKKYRSYWVDCLRTFELVEKKYPKSASAPDACFDRASLYFELYQFNKYSRDLDNSMRTYANCQAAYPDSDKAAEALYRVVDLSLQFRRNRSAGAKAYATLAQSYPRSAWFDKARNRLGVSVKNKKPGPAVKKQAYTRRGKAAQAGIVKGIRHWSEGAYTRIVIDESRPVKFQQQQLKNPDRLVFDLYNARLDSSIHKEPLLINDGILKQVRASQYSSDTVRIVLDLASIKSYAPFPLRGPDRLVIDVTGEGNAAGPGEGTPLSAATTSPATDQGHKNSASPALNPAPDNDGDRLTLSRQLGLKVRTIAIDAGHGGYDPGAIGRTGLKEKDVTLDIAKRLAVLVRERLGCQVVMTRDRDVFIPLDKRPFIAKSHNADLFISIHVNANRKRKTRGIETYVQGLKASDREAMATAARENAMSTRSLGELDNEVDKMLNDLKIDNKIEESIQLAGTVQESLVDTVKPFQRTVTNYGVKRAFFYVLMNTNIPSILAEIGFISNPDEEKLLRKESYRKSIAEALFEGVKKYVEARSPRMMGI